MKVFLYWLIPLTIPLMLSSLTSADTIVFKDGMIISDIGRTWRNDGQVKWKTSGITIGYLEEDVERVEKTPIEEDLFGTQPIVNKKIKKEDKSPFPSLNPLELEVGQTYIVTKRTPLMPSHSPADPIAALQKMKQITAGGGFKVLDMFDKKGNPWYRVSVFDQRKNQILTGWINSAALFGQQLQQTRRTALQNQNKRFINPNPIAKVPGPKVKPYIKAQFRGNTETHKFHSPGCIHYNCKACVRKFSSREEAIQANYVSCKVCRP